MLKKEVAESKRAAYATGTWKNLRYQFRLFINFCLYFQYSYLPASVSCLCLYAQFLSRTVKPDTVRNYVSGVKTLHTLCEISYAGEKCMELKLTLRGIARLKPYCAKQAAPLTPDILIQLFPLFDFDSPLDCTMWALFLLAFFTLSRKSNLVVTGSDPFDPLKQLCREDVEVGSGGLLVCMRWSKTNQFGKKIHDVPLVSIPGHPLCPVRAYKRMIQLVPGEASDPAFFSYLPGSGDKLPITYYLLQKYIKEAVGAIGLNPELFSSHSLRRAGATWAFRSRVRPDLIKSQGDWTSLCYLRYIDFSLHERLEVSEKMSQEILRRC